jgi:chemotaxis protein MotA
MKRLNRSLIGGALFGTFAIFMAVKSEIDGMSASVFVHPVGLMTVFGGIIAAAFMQLPWHELKRVFTRTYYVIVYPRNDYMPTLREALQVSVGVSRDSQFLENIDQKIQNAMLKDGLALITMGYKSEDIRRFLEIKREQNESSLGECSVFYYSMAKLGPAFGLLGTLIGLIILLYYHMSSGNMDKVASSMGIALTATLYGVGVANLVFSPFADYMQYNSERGALQDALVVEAVIQIKERRHPVYLLQALKAYMPREDYAEVDRILQTELLKNDGSSSSSAKGGGAKKAA